MFCKNCGTEIDDGLAFCPECGCKVDAEETPVTEAGNSFYQDPEPETDLFNFNDNATEAIPASSKKKANGLIIAIGAVVAALLVVVVLSKIIFRGGPADKIIKAAQNTAFAGADFTKTEKTTYKYDDEKDEWKSKSEGYWKVDVKKHVIEYQTESKNDYANRLQGLSVDGDKVVSGYYAEYLDDGEVYDEWSSGDKEKIKDVFGCKEDEFWGAVKTLKKKGITGINYEKFFDKYNIDIDDLDDVIEEKDIDNFIKDMTKAINKNAKKKLGYKKSGKTMNFSFDLEDAIEVVLPVLEKYIDDDIYDELEDEIDDELDDVDVNIDIAITIEKGKITKVEIVQNEKSDEAEYKSEVTFEFEKIGKPSGKFDKEVKDAMKDAD